MAALIIERAKQGTHRFAGSWCFLYPDGATGAVLAK